jgi:hypothetical protein
MSPELLLLAALFSLTILVLGWEAWRRRRGRKVPSCPHCGSRLKSVEPGRRHCETCNLYFRRME